MENQEKLTYDRIRHTAPYGYEIRRSLPSSAMQGMQPQPVSAPGMQGRPIRQSYPPDIWAPPGGQRSVPYAAANGMQERGRIRAWAAVLFFILVMAFFYFALPWPLYLLDVPEILSITIQQLFLLVTSVLFVILSGEKLRNVFPVRKPNLMGVLGIIVIYIGVFLVDIVISNFLSFVAYDTMQEMQDYMFGSVSGISYVIYLILMAVLPAFCEEALNRGVVLRGLRNDLRSRALIIGISGILFGVSHFYPVRMLAPAVLGFVMAWIMTETDNLFYTGLLHMMNNGVLLLISGIAGLFITDEVLEQSAEMTGSLSGFETGLVMLMYGLFAPVIIYCGCYLMRRSAHGGSVSFIEQGKGAFAALAIIVPDLMIAVAAIAVMIMG